MENGILLDEPNADVALVVIALPPNVALIVPFGEAPVEYLPYITIRIVYPCVNVPPGNVSEPTPDGIIVANTFAPGLVTVRIDVLT